MTNAELVKDIAGRSGLKQKDTAVFLKAFVKSVGDNMATGEKVRVAGLGVFEKKPTQGREGVIHFGARKGETWKTEDSFKPHFKASQSLEEKVEA